MKNSSYYNAPVGVRTHDLPHTLASNMGKVSHALTHSATALVSALIRPAGESTSTLVNCQQRGGLLSVHGNMLQIYNALELMFRQSTNSTITKQIDLQNLVQTAVNDASLLTLYNGCVSDVSATSLRKDDMFKELTLIYFMVRVNGFCRQTMEQFRQRHRVCRRAKALRKSLQ